MMLQTPPSPHMHSGSQISGMMLRVIAALIPAIISYTWFFGWGLIINSILAIAVALGCEALMLKLRERPLMPFLTDGSAVLTAMLLAFCIPPLAPWWITVLGTAFALIIGKHVYGGLGYNPFNPAMVGYVMLLISFPLEMTSWMPPHILEQLEIGFVDTLGMIFLGHFPYNLSIDALSSATPLDAMKTDLGLNDTVTEIVENNALFGDFGGAGWEWVDNWLLLGGVYLLYKKVIGWQIPLALIGSIFVISSFFFLIDPDTYPSPLFHIFNGATMLAAFFIATDPVSASTTPKGRIVYGIGIGIIIYVIRAWGGYPDAVAFAVLLMNMAAPTIDYYTQPRVYGHARSND